MKKNTEIIKKYVEIMIKRNSSDGEIKPHSVPKLVLVWITTIVFGVFSSMAFPSAITVGVFSLSLVLLFCGVHMFRKKDYRWFLYHCYNALGLLISFVGVPIGVSLDMGIKYLLVGLILFVLSALIGGVIAYNEILNKVKKGWDGSDSSTPRGLFWIGWMAGIIIIRLMPERIKTMGIIVITGTVLGYYTTMVTVVYVYGNRFDPKCEMMKSIQRQMES